MNWQPIDTMPKKGRFLVAQRPDGEGGWYWTEAFWGYSLFSNTPNLCSTYTRRPLKGFVPTHWCKPSPP